MKKILTVAMALVLTVGLVGCNAQKSSENELKIGITYFAPMNYYVGEELVGFETECAEEVCREIGMKSKFIEIDWSSKEIELKSKNIDVIWNGMTWTKERAENMLLSDKYLNNTAVLIVKKGASFESADSVAVAKGSQAENMVASDKFFDNAKIVKVDSVSKSFLEVKSGTVEAAYVDYIAALGMLGDDGDFAELEIWNGYKGVADSFALGFRKEDIELCNKINNAMQKLKDNGRFKELAEKYGMGDLI